MMRRWGISFLSILFGGLLLFGCSRTTERVTCDLLVYGGTPAGVCAALAASDEDLNVVIVEPTGHLGGMMSSGLCASDKGDARVIGGYALKVFEKIGALYGQRIAWWFEPSVAERAFNELVDRPNIRVIPGHWVKKVHKDGTRISSVTFDRGLAVDAPMFIDATYEGDLMARSGVTYVVGRESRDTYDEPHAGVLPVPEEGQCHFDMKGRDPDGSLRGEIQTAAIGELGSGDHKVQAYNFRLCLTTNISNMVPIEKPRGYDEDRFLLLGKYIKSLPNPYLSDLAHFFKLPNGKFDLNHKGFFSTDFLGASWDYPDASYRQRKKIVEAHKEYTQGFLYFLKTNERVSTNIQAAMAGMGFAKDEFADNGHWPYQLYVREGRRMVGEQVLTEHDVRKTQSKADSVGMGSHYIECHHVQRALSRDGFVKNRGGIRLRRQPGPYQIPYGCLVPKSGECTNLLVPVCLSASHVAYNSVRMEPQYMILGHASGLAAALALKNSGAVQAVDVRELQDRLVQQGQILGALPFTE